MKLFSHVLLPALSIFTGITNGQSTFSPARPPAVPLAVKSPYLSTWLYAGGAGFNSGGYLPGQWPQFWQGGTQGWTGMIRVDGTTYTWMGAPVGPQLVTQKSFEYTSTRSIFTMDVGGLVQMKITFMSPVTPEDQKRQSLLFSYLEVEVHSIDDKGHEVQLYTDISGEWASGDSSSAVEWDYGVANDVAYHKLWRQTQLHFSESRDQAEWGNWYYSTQNKTNLSYQSAADHTVREAFQKDGKLPNTRDNIYRAINNDWPVFGFSSDLGSVTSSVSTLYTIGLAQTEAIQFLGKDGLRTLPSLWASYFSSETDALTFFYTDYGTAAGQARHLASNLDDRVAKDSIAVGGQDYLTITSLSVRQAFGALQSVGTLSKNYIFLKEISSNGNTATVDVIFPFSPVLLYLQPNLLKLLLDPLFENQESGHYPNKYAIHDLGTHYPNATGHPDGNDEPMPLEECGNMLIMALAYAERAQDNDYLTSHYQILNQWTQFLIDEALIPADQLSTDDFAGPLANQTNLALKGIIGIEAMSRIANRTSNFEDAEKYTTIAHDYINKWQDLATAKDANPPHTTLSYGKNDTSGLLYNIYGDKLLKLDLVPQSVYDMQNKFYKTVLTKYGLRLDTRHDWTKSDWEIYIAAVADDELKSILIKDLATWIGETVTNRPLSDLYDTPTGDWPVGGIQFTARPVVGGHFALLALTNNPS